jgi:thioester reductase-like protein
MGGLPNVAVEPALERPLGSAETCGDMGYAQSKFVAEKMLEAAASRHPDMQIMVVRASQLAGALNGRWTKSEHVPILMKASVQVGKVPADLAAR